MTYGVRLFNIMMFKTMTVNTMMPKWTNHGQIHLTF